MWRSVSLRNRLNLIFASLFALWLAVDAGHVVFQASGRTRAETQSAMRLTKDFVATALARLPEKPERSAVEALVASLQNLRHVRAGLGDPSLASSIMREANNELDAPQWFRALINAPGEVAAIPVSLSDGGNGVDRHRRRSRRRDRRSLGRRPRSRGGRGADGARGLGGDEPSGRARGEAARGRRRRARPNSRPAITPRAPKGADRRRFATSTPRSTAWPRRLAA